MNKSILQKITYPGYFLKENARLRLAPRNWKKTPETSYHSSCYSTKLHTKRWFHVEIRQIEQTYAKKNKITFFSFFRIFQIIFTWFLDFWGWFFKKKNHCSTVRQCFPDKGWVQTESLQLNCTLRASTQRQQQNCALRA